MPRWSPEQVRQAAPDDASLKAARGLARPGPWSETGATDSLLWGKCQGSGKTPYQVSIDLIGPAYRCSCPSRKFPCKHALALLLLWSEGAEIADVGAPSEFAAEWSRSRSERAAAQEARAQARASADSDPEARARRREARIATMDAGLAEFARWLTDLVRAGTAAVRTQPNAFFDTMAARLVDAQCPALAAEVREAPHLLVSGPDWHDRFLATLGRWWLLATAWPRRDELTEDEQADLRTALGWSWSSDEVRERGERPARLLVLGVHRDDRGRIAEQRTWVLDPDTGDTHLVLDFAAGGEALPMPKVTGAVITSRISSYPGTAPSRVLLLDDPAPGAAAAFPTGTTVADTLGAVAARLAAHPLALRTPAVLAGVVVTPTHVVDAEGSALPIDGPAQWDAVAVTGGQPVDVFGEWSAQGFRPLTLIIGTEAVPCG